MKELKKTWIQAVHTALTAYAKSINADGSTILESSILLQKPPKVEMGDFAVPMFPFAKVFRKAPPVIAAEIKKLLESSAYAPEGAITAAGPYLNIKAELTGSCSELWNEIQREKDRYGWNDSLGSQKIMIEFSCPNTNKPLHLGHLRNDSLGESSARILAANGADVMKVNLINDRGVHICKSMLAYRQFGEGTTPESEGVKGDHFVGNYYVKFNEWAKNEPEAEKEAQELLVKWENDDPDTVELWKKMNKWTLEGIFETYEKTGISFDKFYFESETYKLGRNLVEKGLHDGVFYRSEDGTVWIDLEDINLDKKVLLRNDGTSLYLTQDLGTAVSRHGDWPFQRMIYVVGSEQQYHFRVLFHVLGKLGMPWADNLFHLSYGMVNLPEGKMKSREGTVVDADDLVGTLVEMARQEIIDKNRQHEVGGLDETSASIALGALNYYLLQTSPTKDMIFNPAESISFNGNTGPYLQYMGARISSMLRKFRDGAGSSSGEVGFNPALLEQQDEHTLIKLLLQFPEVVEQAGAELNPSLVAAYLYDLSRTYSRYYHDHPILKAESEELSYARVVLSEMVLQVLKNAYQLLGIPFLESM